jgi:hypothetical protein
LVAVALPSEMANWTPERMSNMVMVTTETLLSRPAARARHRAQAAAQGAGHAAGGGVVDDDRRFHVVVGGDALALLLLGAGPELAGVALLVGDRRQLAFGAGVADRGDHEAVGLLHRQADQRFDGGDLGGSAEAGEPFLAAAVIHCQRAQRGGAAFRLALAPALVPPPAAPLTAVASDEPVLMEPPASGLLAQPPRARDAAMTPAREVSLVFSIGTHPLEVSRGVFWRDPRG